MRVVSFFGHFALEIIIIIAVVYSLASLLASRISFRTASRLTWFLDSKVSSSEECGEQVFRAWNKVEGVVVHRYK